MVKVRERRLGREKALGLAYHDEPLIEIDPRLPPKKWLLTLVHEAIHKAYPRLTEAEVNHGERVIGSTLWGVGIRRVHVK